MTNELSAVKVGDKLNLPATYRGEAIPVLSWTVTKENRKSFGVTAIMNEGTPNWRSFNLLLRKDTWRITS